MPIYPSECIQLALKRPVQLRARPPTLAHVEHVDHVQHVQFRVKPPTFRMSGVCSRRYE